MIIGFPVQFKEENPHRVPRVHGRECHHASAAGGNGGDAPVLDGAFRKRFVDSPAGPAGAHCGGSGAGDPGASSSTATRPKSCSTPAGPRATIRRIFGLLQAGDHLITTSIEHSAVMRAAERMAEHGVETTFVAPRPNGLIDPGGHSASDAAPDAADQRDAGQ